MKVTKKLESEVKQVYHAFWKSLLSVDMKTFNALLDDDFRQIGTTEAEMFFNKKAVAKYLKATEEQIVGNIELRNSKLKIEPLEKYVLITDLCDCYVKIDNKWTFYARCRSSFLLHNTKSGWKFIQQHTSMPDHRTEEGETIALEKITKENLELRDAIKRRTIDLEQKNRELEIETALEKVRAIALSMKDPADMLDVCKTISLQLQSLGVKDIRNVQTAIFYESTGTYMNYEYYTKHKKTFITETLYTNHKIAKAFATKMLKGKGETYITHIRGQKVKDWLAYQKTTNVFIDRFLEKAGSLNYYWHSLGPVALGISSYMPLSKEDLNLFKRFLNVFELAYTRYLDIELAIAQAKEAKIELALERVRARAMAMQHSDELAELVSALFKELTQLDFSLTSCIIWMHDHDHTNDTLWISSAEMNKPAEPFRVKPFHDDFFKSIIHAWKAKDPKWIFKLTGSKKKNFEKAFFKELPKLPDPLRKALIVPREVVFSASFNNFGALEM
jgi:SnoaL-like domain